MAALATTIVCGMSAAATGTASAATPQCGGNCISVFSTELGSYDSLNFVEAILGDGGARTGQPVGLKRADKHDPTQDLMPEAPVANATVADFHAAGLMFAMHLPRDEVASGKPLQMQARRLQFLGDDGTLRARQLWGAWPGELP